MRRVRQFSLIFLLASLGCLPMGTRMEVGGRTVQSSDLVILYSLEPDAGLPRREGHTGERFHDHVVLGSVVLAGKDRGEILEALDRGIRDHDGSAAACFIPHHGLRIHSGASTTDLVICFMCSQMQVYADGKQKESILLSRSPRDTFNRVLMKAGVEVSAAGRQ